MYYPINVNWGSYLYLPIHKLLHLLTYLWCEISAWYSNTRQVQYSSPHYSPISLTSHQNIRLSVLSTLFTYISILNNRLIPQYDHRYAKTGPISVYSATLIISNHQTLNIKQPTIQKTEHRLSNSRLDTHYQSILIIVIVRCSDHSNGDLTLYLNIFIDMPKHNTQWGSK